MDIQTVNFKRSVSFNVAGIAFGRTSVNTKDFSLALVEHTGQGWVRLSPVKDLEATVDIAMSEVSSIIYVT